jgi:hypothetical protein
MQGTREVFTDTATKQWLTIRHTITWPIITSNARTILDEVTKWFLTRERHRIY